MKTTAKKAKEKKETYYKCTHCKDEIFWNTHNALPGARVEKWVLMDVSFM